MSDPASLLAFASAGTAAVAIISAAGLTAWRDWLDVRRLELTRRQPGKSSGIELFELKSRIRNLETIANGKQ
jgi:hypothetical protein